MNTEQQRIIDRIQKLLALATSPNENEARLAAERASELLLRHNLSMQQIKAQPGAELDGYVEHIAYDAPRRLTEQKYILPIIATHFFVKIVRVRRLKNGPVQFVFLGKEVNVQIATYVHDFLLSKFPELWAAYKAAHTVRGDSKSSYYTGLAAGITAQLETKRQAVQTETGLIVMDDPNIERFLAKVIPNTKTAAGWRHNVSDEDAVNAGMEHGRNLSIHRGLNAQRADGPRLALKPKGE